MSLHRMLGPRGNPNTANFFAIPQAPQRKTGVKLTVKAASRPAVSSTRTFAAGSGVVAQPAASGGNP